MLIRVLPLNTPLDEIVTTDERRWQATPQARFERLLRETQVPIGLLCNGTHLRLVYAPRGETAGHLTFPVQAMTETAGRPVFAACADYSSCSNPATADTDYQPCSLVPCSPRGTRAEPAGGATGRFFHSLILQRRPARRGRCGRWYLRKSGSSSTSRVSSLATAASGRCLLLAPKGTAVAAASSSNVLLLAEWSYDADP
jgi:hypothetical protein